MNVNGNACKTFERNTIACDKDPICGKKIPHLWQNNVGKTRPHLWQKKIQKGIKLELNYLSLHMA